MNPVLLPAACFPPISWYACINAGHPVVIEQWETFPKQTVRNRFEIVTADGKSALVVPVTRPNGNRTLTCEALISYREPWQRHHWRTLTAAYRSSPFFSFYEDRLSDLFRKQYEKLLDFNLNVIDTLNGLMAINPEISLSSDYSRDGDGYTDLRGDYRRGMTGPKIYYPAYPQVFNHKHGFTSGLSVLDLLFNLGPEARGYLKSLGNDAPDQA